MRHFCTLFDSGFLARGLVLYDSLVASGIEFQLAVFAFDAKAEEVLGELRLPNLTVIPLETLEDPGLLAVKATRTRAEYCWTSTSSTLLYCLKQLGWPEATYLDADLFFFSSPEPLITEMGSASILLTSHNYARPYDQSRLSGTYCVQFMRFVADEPGLTALRWWRERCLEWCFNRREDGKFGDQFYLEDWPSRFRGVHVLEHQGGGLAPWNIRKYRIADQGGVLSVQSENQSWPAVFYHFHAVRFYSGRVVGLDNYRLGSAVLDRIYQPYLERLVLWNKKLEERYPEHDWWMERPLPRGPKAWMGEIKNRLLGTWNFFPVQTFCSERQGDGNGSNDRTSNLERPQR